jgi:hypothetical protein
MRTFVLFVVLATLAAPAHADNGYFVAESFGGGGFRGELARYDGAPRVQIGFDVRRGPWTFELMYGATVNNVSYEGAMQPSASLELYGLDLRYRWRLLSLRRFNGRGAYERPGLFVALHGGPRWFEGGQAIDGYSGMGLGAGAALEGDVWVIGYFLDAGIDVITLAGDDETLHGSHPYLMIGGKLGWL